MSRRVWVDTDIALGARRGDVDDGFALAALLSAARRGEASIAGVSTVFGNASAAFSENLVHALSEVSGVSVPVFRGAERMGERTEAAERIARLEDGVELLALGPLTNIAVACRTDPTLARRLPLRLAGGNLSSRRCFPPLWPSDFNLTRDLAASRDVLAAPWRELTLYPLDVVRRLRVSAAVLEEICGLSPLGDALARGSRRWLARARILRLARSFPVWDLCAALDSLGLLPARFETRPLASALGALLHTRASFRCLIDFDAAEAWRNFSALLSS